MFSPNSKKMAIISAPISGAGKMQLDPSTSTPPQMPKWPKDTGHCVYSYHKLLYIQGTNLPQQ